MRSLTQPKTLIWASIAALASAVACYPRLLFWLNRSLPVWYLETLIFFCGIILWGFVFAWHAQYARRPVFILKLKPGPFVVATLAGIILAAVSHLFLDPSLRPKLPEEYPADLKRWIAWLLFSLAFNQLFLIFAPFAWSVRLFKNRSVAAGLTVLFGIFVLVIKFQATPALIIPLPLLVAVVAGKIIMGFLVVWFYLRGGVLLVWWWTLLFEARSLLDLAGHS